MTVDIAKVSQRLTHSTYTQLTFLSQTVTKLSVLQNPKANTKSVGRFNSASSFASDSNDGKVAIWGVVLLAVCGRILSDIDTQLQDKMVFEPNDIACILRVTLPFWDTWSQLHIFNYRSCCKIVRWQNVCQYRCTMRHACECNETARITT